LDESYDPYEYDTAKAIERLFNEVDPSHSRRSVTDVDPDGIKLSFGEQGRSPWTSVTIRADPTTGSLVFSYVPEARNPWQAKEGTLTEMVTPYVINVKAEEAKKRGREAKGLTSVMKPGEEGLDVGEKYLPPGVPANILKFLTGEKGSVAQQMKSLKSKATGQGRRKKTKRRSKKHRTTRRQ
jgi:hypothetical protein